MHLYSLIDAYALRQDGSKPLTADWDAGPYKLTARQLESDVAIGTAPLVITSTTLVSNLNADLWDGYQFADYLNQAVKTTSSPTFVTGTFTDIVVDTNLIKTVSATNRIGINITVPGRSLDISGELRVHGALGAGAGTQVLDIVGADGVPTYDGAASTITSGAGGYGDGAVAGSGGLVGLYGGGGGPGSSGFSGGAGGNVILKGGAAGTSGGGGAGAAGIIRLESDTTLITSDFLVPSGSRVLLTAAAISDIAIGSYGNRGSYFEGQTLNNPLTHDYFTKSGDSGNSCWVRLWAKGTLADQTNSESLIVGYSSSLEAMIIGSLISGTGVTVRPIKIYTGANASQFILLANGNNTMAGNLTVGSFKAGDATNYTEVKTDGEINLHGTARVINHAVIHAGAFKLVGLKPAVVDNEGVFVTLDFVHTSETEAYAAQFIPFRWDSDTDVEIVIDWLCDVDATGGDVTWAIEYLARKDNEEVGAAGTTITQSFTGAGAGLNQRSIFTTKLLKANLQADDILGVRIYRDHDNAGDTLNETARFLALHFHFIRDKIGEAT